MRRVLLILLVLLLSAAAASARSLVIQDFHADVMVMEDASISVTETIQPRFTGSWNGIYRKIPVDYYTPQGFGFKLLLELQSITDENGNGLKYESSREGKYQKYKIWVPGALDATRTVVIRYTVPNGLRFFEDHDELYWNITGDEWEVPIESVSAKVSLPTKAEGIRAVVFTGGYGSTEHAADIKTLGSTVEFQTTRPLNFREGLTVAVAWDPGVVHRPTFLQKTALFLRANLLFLVPLFALIGMYWLWSSRGRDPRLRPIAAQYEPPEQMTPAEAGALVDNSADMSDITATIVDLAVRGYILIEEQADTGLLASGLTALGIKRKEYLFVLRKKSAEWSGLQSHETELLNALFEGGLRESVSTSELENTFYKNLPTISSRIFDLLLARRFYAARPDKVKQGYVGAAVLIGFFAVFGGVMGQKLGWAPVGTIAAGLLTAVIVGAFGVFMPARTFSGARALEGVLGFEEFLNRVESDRFARVVKTPEMFEKFLPYAMALRVEKNWARAFADIYREPPEWYHGGGFTTFNAALFASSLSSMSTQAASAMSSSPRSSGGSGFGGGGGSGGGGGGGGGGGF